MSGLDIASGIAGLIALALQVSGAIAEYAIAIKDYSKNVKELQDELQLLGNVLSRLGDFIQNEKARGRFFEHDSVLVGAISDCKRRIERIGDKLRPSDGSRLSRAIDKLKWPFEQKDILQLVENLRRYIHTFEFAVTIKNSEFLSQSWDEARKNLKDLQKRLDQACEFNKSIGEPIDTLLQRSKQLQTVIDVLPTLVQQSEDLKEVSQVVKLAEQREQERRKADILDWLIPISALSKHIDLQVRRAPDTCKWLLDNEMFVEWASSDNVQYDMLCQGGPGVGKTVLCSMVIDHLRTKHKNEDVAVAYYYFDLAQQQAQTEYSLVKSILRQLCQNFKTIPSAVADFYQRTRNELQDSLWLQELQTVLQRVIATFSRCFIVIDAFDEMDSRKRRPLMGVLEIIRASSGCVKVFATSRPHIELDYFQTALKLDVRADEHDLRSYLNQKIDAHPHTLDIIDPILKEEILDKLCLHADGVFLLPALQIDQILDQAVSAGDIERAIGSLSTDLKEVFQSTIVRIESFSGGKRNLAFKTLMWLSHAHRPLRISELQHAIATRFDKTELDVRDVSSISVILDSCCGLVELDGESASIKFVHGSIGQYLQSHDHGFFQNAEEEIVRVSLKYLTMEQLKTLPSKNRNDFYRAMESYPLLDYASSFWGVHARGLKVQAYQDLAVPFLNSSVHLLVTARIRDIKTPDYRKWKDRMMAWSVSGGAGISLAASFGLADLTELLIGQSQNPVLDARNMYGSTPLHQCAIFGYDDTAEVLLAHGADLLDTNKGKATPFYLAVSYGQLDMCRKLLKWDKTQLDIACREANTALHKAADIGNDVMVEFLLQSGAQTEVRNKQGMTPLHCAVRRGYTAIARMLVLAGANIHAGDNDRLKPLDFAALGGHLDTTKYLLQQGAYVNDRGKESWTPLHRAARAGHTQVVQTLLAANANLYDLDRQRAIPLQHAVKSGNLETVLMILNHDEGLRLKQLKHRDWKKDKAIDIAFYTSHYHVYKLLRDIEGELISESATIQSDPLLPLSRAIEQGNILQVQELLQLYPEWRLAKDSFDQTALHTAFRTQQWSIAEYLLSTGAPINLRGYHGWTPLHIAASLGDLRMLSLALQYDADIFLVSDTLQTVLHKAASSRSVAVVLELLRCGSLPTVLNDKAMSPVHVAARQNFLEGVLVMTRPEYGGRNLLFKPDKYGRTPRAWAERAGHLDLSSVLKDEERRAKGHMVGNSRPSSISAGTGSPVPLSRQSTREVQTPTRRTTGTSSSSLLLPTFERSYSHADSIGSNMTVGVEETGNSGLPSPLRTPGTPNPHSNVSTPPPFSSPITEMEQRYADMQLEFESD